MKLDTCINSELVSGIKYPNFNKLPHRYSLLDFKEFRTNVTFDHYYHTILQDILSIAYNFSIVLDHFLWNHYNANKILSNKEKELSSTTYHLWDYFISFHLNMVDIRINSYLYTYKMFQNLRGVYNWCIKTQNGGRK